MVGRFDENKLYQIYETLNNTLSLDLINGNIDKDKFTVIDPLLKLILLNNGCATTDDEPLTITSYTEYDNSYQICWVTNMIGNRVNEFYDFVNFNGTNILIIFIDYFRECIKIDYDPEDYPLGNSNAYDALCKLVDIIITTLPGIWPVTSQYLLSTAMNVTNKWACKIITLHILNKFSKITDNDVCDMRMEDVENILSGNIRLQLYGCRQI